MVCYRLWQWYVTAYATILGKLVKLPNTICNHFRQPLMEIVCNRSVYSLSTICLALVYTVYGNGKQPLMEMEGECLGNRLWKWKGSVWATAYGNGM